MTGRRGNGGQMRMPGRPSVHSGIRQYPPVNFFGIDPLRNLFTCDQCKRKILEILNPFFSVTESSSRLWVDN